MLLQGGAVTPAWAGKTVACICTGPSLSEAQIEAVRAAREADTVRVIAVNDAYLVAPFSDVLYYADEKWRGWQVSGIERVWPWQRFSAEEVRSAFISFRGQRCSLLRKGTPKQHQDTEYLQILLGDGLSLDKTGIATGSNSGHQALNIAALSGVKLVLLLGYDAKPGKTTHAFGEHPDKTQPPYSVIRRAMKTTQAGLRQLGVRVVNCTPGSAIDCFERGELESLLSHSCAPSLSA